VVNHEYTNPELMFKGFDLKNPTPTREQANLMLQAHGLSVVEIRRKSDGSWEYIKGSPFNRRITGDTVCLISGPAKGHRLMKTSYDPNGLLVYGTLNNCAAGKTPWGTVLTCEENFHSYFGGDLSSISDDLVRSIHQRYGVPSSRARRYGFHMYHDRFNINIEPNEAFRFGWVVEVDPYDPTRPPVKRTALGRFKHEAATTVVANDGRVVVYMGDDERFEYVYKFVTKGKYDPLNRTANFGLLDEGTLYVAKFNDDLTGEWIPIATVDGNRITPNPNLPEPFQSDPVLCFINTRRAGDLLGATKIDRPEDVEWNPITKSVFVALTYNERRGASGQPGRDAANPRSFNHMGHIIEIKEQNNDPTSTRFAWVMAMLCGDPRATEENRKLYIYGQPANETAPAISAPDNFAFDKLGNVWIATDGNPSPDRLAKNDCVYTLNVYTKELKMFLSGAPGCEICGPEFSEDYKTFFCTIQHPGEGGFDTKWPYLGDGVVVPRPAVIQVQRNDGREVYL
jgi:secreted PhoX family phosphatase